MTSVELSSFLLMIMLARLRNRPFAAAVASFLFSIGLTALLGLDLSYDILRAYVPSWTLTTLAVFNIAAGVLIFLGLLSRELRLEAAGSALAISAFLIRLVMIVHEFGLRDDVIAVAFFYVFFSLACLDRFIQCLRGDHIVRIVRVRKNVD